MVVLIPLGVVCALFAYISYPLVRSARVASAHTACRSNVRQLCNALIMYSNDYDDRLPTEKWGTLVTPFLSPDHLSQFHCPEAPVPFTYAMNSGVAGRSFTEPEFADQTVLLIEGNATSIDRVAGKGFIRTCTWSQAPTIGMMDGQAKHFPLYQSKVIWDLPRP